MIIQEGVISAKKRFPKYADHIDAIAFYYDSSPTKKYTEGLTGYFHNDMNGLFEQRITVGKEFASVLKPLFKKFYELTQNHIIKGKEADIGSHKDINEIRDVVSRYTEREFEKKQVPVKKYGYQNKGYGNIPIFYIETKEQAQKYGYRAKGCVSAIGSKNRFDQYNNENFVFFVFFQEKKFCVLVNRHDNQEFQVGNDENKIVRREEVIDGVPESFFLDIIEQQQKVGINENMLGNSTEYRHQGRGFNNMNKTSDKIGNYIMMLKRGDKLRLKTPNSMARGKYLMMKGNDFILYDPYEHIETPVGYDFIVNSEFAVNEMTDSQREKLIESLNNTEGDK